MTTLAHSDVKNTRGMHAYDLRSVIAEALEPGRPRFAPPSGLPGEVHADLRSRFSGNLPVGAILLPNDIWPRTEHRALTTSTGSGSIATNLVGGFIPALRSKLVLGALGARITDFNPGVAGSVKLSRVKTGSGVAWVDAEGDAAAETALETESVVFVAHDLTTRTSITRTMLSSSSSSSSFTNQVAGDILAAIAVAVDKAGIAGSGEDGEPRGLLSASGLPTVALGANGAAPTRANLVTIEKTAANANAESGADSALGWLTSPDVRAKLRLTENATGSGRYLFENGRILDSPAGVSTNVPNDLAKGSSTGLSAIVFGDWTRLGINLFGPPFIIVDPFKQSLDGTVHITVGIQADVQPLQVAAFCAAVDVVTSLS
jgi:HK97 family phage major capsid protein